MVNKQNTDKNNEKNIKKKTEKIEDNFVIEDAELSIYMQSIKENKNSASACSNCSDELNLKVESNDNVVIQKGKPMTLDECMNNAKAFEIFSQFSKLEHTEESIEFLTAVKKFKEEENREECVTIIDRFIVNLAPKEINISSTTRENILSQKYKYENNNEEVVDFTIFDDAYEVVKTTIQNETLARFNKSGLYMKKSTLNASRFRRFMLFVSVMNMLCFIIITIIAVVTSNNIGHSYKSHTHSVDAARKLQALDAELSLAGRLATYSCIHDVAIYNKFKDTYHHIYKEYYDKVLIIGNITDINIPFINEISSIVQNLTDLESEAFQIIENKGNRKDAQAIYDSEVYIENEKKLSEGLEEVIRHIRKHHADMHKNHNIVLICTITIAVVFFIYTVPAVIHLVREEQKYNRQMGELAKVLRQKMQ